ncbi:MAG: hypothetical protein J6U90_04980 [Methanobrevibacter sp.]|nr:hypothetical protein [Methanobrevibacter sp.]
MDILKIYNTIWQNGSAELRARLPQGTTDNIADIQSAITSGENVHVANEFMKTLMNKIVKPQVHTKIFTNPLKSLKKGNKPLGDGVEEIYNNFIKAKQYDKEGKELLTRELPDTKTLYHRMNSQLKYKTTVSREALTKAFVSWESLEKYVNDIISTLNNSAELDEFTLTKELIKIALELNAMKVIPIPDPLASKTNAENFIKTVKTTSGLMKFPSSDHNAYLNAQKDDDIPLITFSRPEEQVLIIDTITDTTVSIDVLAAAFNMTVVEFNETRKIVIDYFPVRDVRAVLVDEAFFQIYDDLWSVASFDNPDGLYQNYWLHVWMTYAFSILVNAVAFKVASDNDGDGEVEQFSISYELGEGVTSSNKRSTANEGGSFTTTISGASSVTVTMGGTAVNDAYDSESGKVSISTVTGDIVITATV